ncbi:hypothetical protein SynPROS91_00853 [Synechococcus sp. PROS-9-1]|nr:hypothetical protein SynPROS91_00853 [Synechococcus sp. PROS-9-1]
MCQPSPTGIGVKAHCQTSKSIQSCMAVITKALKPNVHQCSAIARKDP